ncbi:iron-containing alcohol dehydrogenase [Heyndrickxia coagulans]|uniref:Alcohol dehydrogenase n=1 Tax=Heyndrickxia coagulans TaxID=1398 RepID=A0A150KIK1_HEYCO|nr:iron-containing alcohol dehydrogenase [Heyndrickxia coagulans]KYC73543.1 Alcohol dehydrogenase [Heyndrickxia coagulans]
MRQAVFRTPQTILYGKQSFEKIGEEAARRGKKALIVTDKIMAGLGNADACQRILQEAGVKSAVYAGVNAEPVDHYVSEALTVFQQESCDLLVSLGGGSCIDTAKAVAVVATNGGYIGDYMGGRKMAEKPPVPHIAVPTTAGTGSEATDATIITNTARDVKMMIKQPAFMPAVAIVDPVLSKSSPKPVTAATGVDALSHAIEAYISRRAHPLTDTLALSAMRLIIPHLKSAYEDGENMEARDAMSLGSLQAGMAFSNASVCLVHGMSRPIGALFHVPHGISNAMLLPAVLEFSKSACLERLADIGNIFSREVKLSGKEAADLAVSAVKQLCLDLNIPNLSGWGIPQQSFESAINKMASDALASGSPQNNPRVPSQKEIEDLYLVCYDYQFSGKVQARG